MQKNYHPTGFFADGVSSATREEASIFASASESVFPVDAEIVDRLRTAAYCDFDSFLVAAWAATIVYYSLSDEALFDYYTLDKLVIPVRLNLNPKLTAAQYVSDVKVRLHSRVTGVVCNVETVNDVTALLKESRDFTSLLHVYETRLSVLCEEEVLESKLSHKINVAWVLKSSPVLFCQYAPCFTAEFVTKLLRRFLLILKHFLVYPAYELANILPLLPEEREVVLSAVIGRQLPWPDKTLLDVFMENLRAEPNAPAVCFGDKWLSRCELFDRALIVACYLQTLGVKPGISVGICLSRCLELAVAFLAVQLAGGVICALEFDEADDSLYYKMKLAQVRAVLTLSHAKARLLAVMREDFPVITMDSLPPEMTTLNLRVMPQIKANIHDPIYIVFTSGSTGEPKGCKNWHGSVFNRMYSMWREFNITEQDIFLQKTPLTFDVHNLEIHAVHMGARLVIAEPNAHKDPLSLIELISQHKISIIHFVPSMLMVFLECIIGRPELVKKCASLRLFLMDGEAVSVKLQCDFFRTFPGKTLACYYGPAEAAIDVSLKICTSEADITENPLGCPIDNAGMMVVHPRLRWPMPPDVAGELCLFGVPLGEYLNSEQNAEKFFISGQEALAHVKMYASGDLARYCSKAGEFIFIGRCNKNEVKIRGVRIELSAIEKIVHDFNSSLHCVAIVKECGYEHLEREVVIFVKGAINAGMITKLRRHFTRNLNQRIKPLIVEVSEFPLNKNGKIDRDALEKYPIVIANEEKAVVLPKNAIEQYLLEVIRASRVYITQGESSTTDNIFEIGMQSVGIIAMLNKINLKYNIALHYADVLVNTTIQQLAARIYRLIGEAVGTVVDISVQSIDYTKMYPLSEPQRRLHFLVTFLDKNISAAYNLVELFRIDGECLDVMRLQEAFRQVIREQGVFRTIFSVNSADDMQQSILDPEVANDFVLQTITVDDVNSAVRKLISLPFNIEFGDLPIRAALVNDAKCSYLAIVIHHLFTDGVSQNILLRSLSFYYQHRNSKVIVLPVQYCHFAQWQVEMQDTCEKRKIEYWSHKLADVPCTMLPIDKPVPVRRSYAGTAVNVVISADKVAMLEEFARYNRVSLATLMTGIFAVLVQYYTSDNDVLIATASSGRNQYPLSLAEVMGFFVNVILLRMTIDPTQNFSDVLLHAVAPTIKEAFINEIPYESVVKFLKDSKRWKMPLGNVVFVYEEPDVAFELAGVEVNRCDAPVLFSRVYLEVHCQKTVNGCMQLRFEYSTELFCKHKIELLAERFVYLAELLVSTDYQHKPLRELDLLVPEEKKFLLKFNNNEQYFKRETLQEAFEKVVITCGDKAAVEFDANALTYKQLDVKANKVARFLLSELSERDIVLVFLKRSLWLPIVILAATKANIVPIPIDSQYPAFRIRNVLAKSRAKLIIVDNEHAAIFSASKDVKLLNLDDANVRSKIDIQRDETLNSSAIPGECSHMICTSGSTGEPKLVQLTHEGMLNVVFDEIADLKITEDSRVLQFASSGFDAFFWELWGAFLGRATLCMARESELLPGRNILDTLSELAITHATLPPPLLLVTTPGIGLQLKVLVSAGSALSTEVLVKWMQVPSIELIANAYGPTETSICLTKKLYPKQGFNSAEREVFIGSPVANTTIQVVDQYGRKLPSGVPGVLCAAGVGVMLGYMNDPAATQAVFLHLDGRKYYVTGDVVTLEYGNGLKYRDRQHGYVKISGYRVDPQDVATNILQTDFVNDVYVQTKFDEDTNSHNLIAYVCVDSKGIDVKRQLASWQKEFDKLYSTDLAKSDAGMYFDQRGWIDRITMVQIPVEQMELWADAAYARISRYIPSLLPLKIHDIGCGTGALLWRFLKQYEQIEYLATDISDELIKNIQGIVWNKKKKKATQKVSVKRESADVGYIKSHAVTILNSVLQYCVSIDYLRNVVAMAVSSTMDGGSVFLGDVKDLRLQAALQSEFLLTRGTQQISLKAFKAMATYLALLDNELSIDPEFFKKFTVANERITGVRIEIKNGSYDNELSKYRYDVTFFVRRNVRVIKQQNVIAWSHTLSLCEIEVMLAKSDFSQVSIIAVPNPRLLHSMALFSDIAESLQTVADFQKSYSNDYKMENVWSIEDLYKLGAKYNCDVLLMPSTKSPFLMDCIFTRFMQPGEIICLSFQEFAYRNDASYVSNPSFAAMCCNVVKELRSALLRVLPAFAVPSRIVVLPHAIPLNAHGKVDVEQLPPGNVLLALDQEFVAPRTALEQRLAIIVSEVVNVDPDKIGITYDFINDLGGDSALMVLLTQKICANGVFLEVAELYENRTIEKLIVLLEERCQVTNASYVNGDGPTRMMANRS